MPSAEVVKVLQVPNVAIATMLVNMQLMFDTADILVDGMRGRSSVWYRIRLNLRHVPEAERPPQEPLEVDYDPWAGFRP